MRRMVLSLRTARYLRWTQLLAMARRALEEQGRREPGPRGWDHDRARIVAQALRSVGPVDEPHSVRRRTDAWRRGSVEMLGERHPAPTTWLESPPSPLWGYHLQYHDLLAEAAWVADVDADTDLAQQIKDCLESWFSAWGRGGTPAWDAYPISVRSVNWIRILAMSQIDAAMKGRLEAALADQIATLRRNIELHLQANHLLRNAWALAIAPWCLSDPHGSAWAIEGAKLYWRLLLEQVAPDGVHEERTPMYHARVLRDALEVIAVHDALGTDVPPECRARVATMAHALLWMRHPNGALRLINDSAGDHGIDLGRLEELATMLCSARKGPPAGLWYPPAARFVSVRDNERSDALFVDVGGAAPPHQPGHTHAGALGFELDIDGLPFIIDAGCSGYEGDEWRSYFRGTAAHNTVMIDGRDQSEMWATFRVARRARVQAERVMGDVRSCVIEASCRPYHRRAAAHHRQISREGRTITVADRVDGADDVMVKGFLHFDPGWSFESTNRSLVARQSTSLVTIAIDGPVRWALHRGQLSPPCGWFSPTFGKVGPTYTLVVESPPGSVHAWRAIITPG